VFDPCAARNENGMKQAVRRLAECGGLSLTPLPLNDAHARCCGYGGQPGVANPEYAAFVADKRVRESETPYIVYCINCRDVFIDAGKEAEHILEVIFGGVDLPKRLPTVSERRRNRSDLKRRLLKRYWGEETVEAEGAEGTKGASEAEGANGSSEGKGESGIKVNIPLELSEKLSRDKILEDDIIDVVRFCERTGRKTYLPEKGVFSGYREEGLMTCWAEYRETSEKNAFELVNAYSHRMKIELEAVWNGKRTDADLR
jgi:hypothetical protein